MLALKMIMNTVDTLEDKINNIESKVDPTGVQARVKRTRMEVLSPSSDIQHPKLRTVNPTS